VPLGTQQKAVEGVYDRVVQPFTGDSDRLVRLFHNIDSRKGANLHDFGATLPVQGNVKLGTKQLLEVKAPEAGFLRATSYEEYTGAGWKAADRESERIDGGVPVTTDIGEYEQRNGVALQVRVLDEASVVLSGGMPIGSNRDVTVETPKDRPGEIEVMKLRRGLDRDETYTSFGSQSFATADELRAAGTEYPEWVTERYLQLPDSLPTRVGDEAQRVAGGSTNAYDQALAIQDYLRGFPYNLEVESAPPKQDVVDFFLFDLKQGYFDYHASAMAVMLRSIGIPARVAVGYALDPDEATDGTYTVRKDDAYSWVEAWFPKYGWIEFNPTPNRPGGGAGGSAASDPSGDVFSGIDLGSLFGNEAIDPGILPDTIPPEVDQVLQQEPIDQSSPPWLLIWTLAGILTVIVAALLAARVSWNWGLGGLDERARLWAKSHRLAGWVGLGGRPEETPREWSRRVGTAVAREDDARRLAEAYEEARYGRPDLQRIEDEDAATAYRELRNTLFGRIFRRKSRESADANRTPVRKPR
jgi:transglutaminase-like putative cysteine protease